MKSERKAGVAVIEVKSVAQGVFMGYVGVRRGAPQGYGGLCFPGGYANKRESTLDATRRETFEELGVMPKGEWSLIAKKRIQGVVEIDFWHLLVPWSTCFIERTAPCPREVLGVEIMTAGDCLVFPVQQEVFSNLVAKRLSEFNSERILSF